MLNVSLKGSTKGMFPTNIFDIKIFILKFAKTLCFALKLKIDIFASKVMSGLPTVKTAERNPYLF